MTELQDKLDGDVPDDVPHWIVKFHSEFDERQLTPLDAAKRAYRDILQGHSCLVIHVRSGLTWSVSLERQEVIEVEIAK